MEATHTGALGYDAQRAALAAVQPAVEAVFTATGLQVESTWDRCGDDAELTIQISNGRMGPDGIGGQELQSCRLIISVDRGGYTLLAIEPVIVADPWWNRLDRQELVAVASDWAIKLADSKQAVIVWLWDTLFDHQATQSID